MTEEPKTTRLQHPSFHATQFDGETTIEMWNGEKKLTLFVEHDQSKVTYLKSWGPHMINEMEDGELQDKFLDLWDWLVA